MKEFFIPKWNNNVTNNYFVNSFVDYVRANNYPNMNTDKLLFEGSQYDALCTKLDPNDSAVYDCAEDGKFEGEKKNVFLDKDERFERFDGGWVLQDDRKFHVAVDGHFYYFDF